METKSEEIGYKCFTCGKYFKRKAYLTVHWRAHTGERPYVCSLCNKSFSQNSPLVTHMKIHSDQCPYACTICGRFVKLKHYLTLHLRVHSWEQAYTYSVCFTSFSYKYNLSRHMISHKHQVVSEAHENEAKEILSSCESNPSIFVHNRGQDECQPTCTLISNKIKYPSIHSSEIPFIINVKQEEDM